VIRNIKKDPQLRNIPVIAFTAYLDIDKHEEKKLFSGHLYKPVKKQVLYEMLSNYLPHEKISEEAGNKASVEKKFSRPDHLQSCLSAEERKKIPELLKVLKSKYLPQWANIKDHWVLFKIEEFARQLKQTAKTQNIRILEEYSNTLLEKADRVDLEAVKSTLAVFPDIIRQLEQEAEKKQ